MINNKVYSNQFYLLAFISIVTYKVGMLPSLLSLNTSSDAVFSMAIMMVIELMMLILVSKIIKTASILEIKMPKFLKAILLFSIFISLSIKLCTFSFESTIYVKEYVFESAPIYYVLIPLILTISYIAYKGINNIARVSEIIIVILFAAFFFNVLFANIDAEVAFFKNLTITENCCVGIDRYIVWFGDFTPLLFARIIEDKKKNVSKSIFILAIVLIPILLMLAFVCIFESAGKYIEFAFSKLAVYNQFSFLLGSFDIPTIISFLIAMIIKLSLILFAIIEILTFFFEKKKICTLFCAAMFLTFCLIINEKERMLKFSTSCIRYITLAVEYTAPIILYIVLSYQNDKQKCKVKEYYA